MRPKVAKLAILSVILIVLLLTSIGFVEAKTFHKKVTKKETASRKLNVQYPFYSN